MSANASANRREWIRDPGVAVCLLIPPLRYEGDVASGLRMNWAGLHAGEVRLEPLQVYEFGPAGHEACPGSLSRLLLNRQFYSCTSSGDFHCLSGWLAFFAPRLQGVLTRGNVLDLEIAIFVGYGKVGSEDDDYIAGHFGVYVAKKRSRTEIVELEWLLISLRPSAEIVRELLVAADRRPVHVVADRVAVQEVHSSTLLHGNDMRDERHFALVDHHMFARGIELLVCDYIHVYRDILGGFDPLYAHFTLDIIGANRANQAQRKTCCHHCFCCDSR